MTRLIALLMGVLLLATLGIWYFLDEIFVVWLPTVITFIKGLTLAKVIAYLVVVAKRLLLWELPKRIGLFWLWATLVSPRIRRRIRRRWSMVQERTQAQYQRVLSQWKALVGERTAFAIGVVVAGAVFILSLVWFGAYAFVWIGREQIGWVWSFIWPRMHNLLVKTIIFTHADRLFRRFVPEAHRQRFQALRTRVILQWLGKSRTAIDRARKVKIMRLRRARKVAATHEAPAE